MRKQSGTPSISPEFLAPTGSGALLLQLTASEFESRCMKTPGVTFEQAMAFRSKLWQLHIDSKKAKNISTTRTSLGPTGARFSSQDLDSSHQSIPFQDRIQPGMVISWQPSLGHSSTLGLADGLKLAAVLCPERAGDDGAADVRQYRCALVPKAVLPEAYELHLWRQVVIDVDKMENEIILEYDAATRYYFIAI
jgi:kinesin family protein 2/24